MARKTEARTEINYLEDGETAPAANAGLTLRNELSGALTGAAGRSFVARTYEPEPVSGGAWAPTDEASLGGYYDPENASTITEDTNVVSAISDVAGIMPDFVQSDVAQRPTLAARASFNNRLALNFTEPQNLDLTGMTWGGGSLQWVFAAEVDSVPNAVAAILRGGGGTSWFRLQSINTSGFLPLLDMFGSGNADISSVNHYEGAVHIFHLVMNITTGALEIWVDGTKVAEDPNGYQTAINGSELHLFGFSDVIDGLVGALGRLMLFYSEVFAVGERGVGFLSHHYNRQGLLPAGHPYKDAAP